MRKCVYVFSILMLAGWGAAIGQDLPDPLPEDNPDAQALADSLYPSATVCAECHPRQFEQWAYSSHAYATMSPMFNKFEQALNNLAQGTTNYFCLRCHASVATSLGEPRDIALWHRSKASREGITCITCHRIGEAYGKVNGERAIIEGPITEPVYGPFDAEGVLEVISNPRKYKVQVSPDQPDRPGWTKIHRTAYESPTISASEFCAACHQVQVHPGIKLETVWEEYRASPAAKEDISCQECHMSTVPGQPTGYSTGWAAVVNGKYVREDRPLADHSFIGPGYPVSHPGLFPISKDESPFSIQQWLAFDYRARWGSEEFEKEVADAPGSHSFPDEWQNVAARQQAWGIVEANLERWKDREKLRHQLVEGASHLDGPFFENRLEVGKSLSFKYKVTSRHKGHNLPSGSLGAQPQVWLNVALTDPDGDLIWESGYVDSRGDMADIHSLDVAAGTVEFDNQLFNLQAKFLTTNLKGTDREMYLPVNFDGDQLPFIRPGNTPVSLLNHPTGVRMEKRSIPPLGSKFAKYKVPGKLLTKAGTYRLAVRLRSRSEPIYFMEFVGATNDMKRAMNEWITDTHAYAVEFDLGGRSSGSRSSPAAKPAAAASEEATAREAAEMTEAEKAARREATIKAGAAAAEAAREAAAARAAAEQVAAEKAARREATIKAGAAAAQAAREAAAARAAAEQVAAEQAAEQAATEKAMAMKMSGFTHRVSAAAEPCLSLRAEPNPGSERLECLAPGAFVEVVDPPDDRSLDPRDDWSRIRRRDGTHGWMITRLLEPVVAGGEGS